MIPLEEARRIVLGATRPLEVLTVDLADAIGHAAAEDVTSPEDVPPWDFAAMDGFAVRAEALCGASCEHPARLEVIGAITAGQVAPGPLAGAQALRIMTGAPVPPGADAVIKVEDTRPPAGDEHHVLALAAVAPGENVSPRAHDVRSGDILVRPGTLLRPQELGVLASVGITRIKVHRRPRLAVLCTGDEIVPFDRSPGPGQIRSSNSLTLVGQGREAGAHVTDLGVAPDDLDLIVRRLESVRDHDAVITSGGSARGDKDYAEESFHRRGVRIEFHRVAIKPGKPVLFGVGGAALYFGLPGNPVASMLTFELFVRPALLRMRGLSLVERPRLRAALRHPVHKEPGKVFFLRGILREGPAGLEVESTGHQGSSVLSSMTRANAIAVIPSESGVAEAGTTVDVIPIGDFA